MEKADSIIESYPSLTILVENAAPPHSFIDLLRQPSDSALPQTTAALAVHSQAQESKQVLEPRGATQRSIAAMASA
jgi:hypothetical protein